MPELPANEVITGEVRLSYANLLEAKASQEGEKKQFSVQLLIPISDTKTIDAIKAATQVARQNGVTEGKKPFKDFTPEKLAAMNISYKNGNAPEHSDRPEMKDCIALNAYAAIDRPPGILMPDGRTRILKDSPNATECYSGMYGLAHIQFYPYKNKKEGIACCILNLKKTKDGDPFGGGKRAAPEDVFGDGSSPFESTPAPVASGVL